MNQRFPPGAPLSQQPGGFPERDPMGFPIGQRPQSNLHEVRAPIAVRVTDGAITIGGNQLLLLSGPNAGRIVILIQPDTGNTIYIGKEASSTTTGFRVLGDGVASFTHGEAIYAYSPSGGVVWIHEETQGC